MRRRRSCCRCWRSASACRSGSPASSAPRQAGGWCSCSRRAKLFEGLDASGAARGKIEFARDLLTDAEPLAIRLEVAVSTIRTPKVAERVRHMARISREIFAGVEEDPLRVDRVRRFLTYYLPRAADLAEAYAVLEKSGNRDAKRLARRRGDLIDRLDPAFTPLCRQFCRKPISAISTSSSSCLKSSLDEDLGHRRLPVRRSRQKESLMAISRRAFGIGLLAASAAGTGRLCLSAPTSRDRRPFRRAEAAFRLRRRRKGRFLANPRVRSLLERRFGLVLDAQARRHRSRWCANARCSTRNRNSSGRPRRCWSILPATPASRSRATR